MKRVIIWGAGPSGVVAYDNIKNEYEVVAFADNSAQSQGGKFCGKDVIPPEDVYCLCRQKSVDFIVMGVSENNYDDVYTQIKSALPEWDDIYYAKQWGQTRLIKYTGRCLGYLQLDATRNCNLNCRGCIRYSNITDETLGYSLESLEKDFRQLSTLYDNIAVVVVVGGEPLIRKDLDKCLEIIKRYFPETQLKILSNGILIPGLDETFVKVLKELDVRLEVTVYEPTKKILADIRSFCSDNGIPFKEFVIDRSEFQKQLNLRGDSDVEYALKYCPYKKCAIIKDGVMNRCSIPVYNYELNKHYGTQLPENIGINIYGADITREKIREFFKNTEFCRYCTKPEFYTWHNGKEKAVLSDWVVE